MAHSFGICARVFYPGEVVSIRADNVSGTRLLGKPHKLKPAIYYFCRPNNLQLWHWNVDSFSFVETVRGFNAVDIWRGVHVGKCELRDVWIFSRNLEQLWSWAILLPLELEEVPAAS